MRYHGYITHIGCRHIELFGGAIFSVINVLRFLMICARYPCLPHHLPINSTNAASHNYVQDYLVFHHILQLIYYLGFLIFPTSHPTFHLSLFLSPKLFSKIFSSSFLLTILSTYSCNQLFESPSSAPLNALKFFTEYSVFPTLSSPSAPFHLLLSICFHLFLPLIFRLHLSSAKIIFPVSRYRQS